MLTNIILSRGLGAAKFGAYNAVISTAQSGFGMLRMGVDAGLHIHMAEVDGVAETGRKDAILGAALVLLGVAGVLGAVAVFGTARQIATAFYHNPALAPWLRVAAILLFLQCLYQFAWAALAGLHEFGRFAGVTVALAVVNLPALAIAVKFGGVGAALAVTAVVNAVILIGLLLVLRAALRRNALALRFKRIRWAAGKLLAIGFPFFVAGLVSIPVLYFIQARLVQAVGLESLGYLRIVGTFTTLILFIPSSTAAATVSTLAEVRSDPNRLLAEFASLAVLNIKLLWFVALFAAIWAFELIPYLVPALFGKEYQPAIVLARISIFGSVFMAVSGAASNSFFAARRVSLVFIQNVSFSLVFAVGSLLTIPHFGIIGYSLSEFTGYAVVALPTIIGTALWAQRSGVSARPLFLLLAVNLVLVASAWCIAWLAWPLLADVVFALLGSLLLLWVGHTHVLSDRERQLFHAGIYRLRAHLVPT